MPQLELSLLGSPQTMVDGATVKVVSRKALALLFYLAVTEERHHRDHLATLLWPEQDQGQARASLRQVLWLLKKAGLEQWLAVEQDTLGLQTGYRCDVQEFRAQIEAGGLVEAIALYRDEFLTGFTLRDCPQFDQWQFLQADELQRLLANVLETLMQQCAEAGDYEEALSHARRWLSLDPLVEEVHRHLMRLYALAGQQAVALRQYEECVRILDEEFGVPPAEETIALYNAVRTRQLSPIPHQSNSSQSQKAPQQASSTLAAASIPLPVQFSRTLPEQLTPFIGRQREVAEMMKLVTDPAVRLLTITGPGGIGKTRLALHLASQLQEKGHKVVVVDLQPVQTPDAIPSAVIDALHISHNEQADLETQLLRYLGDRGIVLVLDNFEHLLEGVDTLNDVLQAAPGVKVLVTSRSVLNLKQEWIYAVAGLPYPVAENGADLAGREMAEYAATKLFVSCAQRVRPDFQLTAEAAGVAAVCRLVEGMPLAIEMAAAWAKTLTADAIAQEIAHDLEFLSTPLRNVPQRHRSMQVVFQRSWQLLSAEERTIFKRLSLFRGGFDREAAGQVAGASLSILTALIDKSFLCWHANGRYTIHELLRQDAAGKLAAEPEEETGVLARHRTYYLGLLQRLEVALRGSEQAQALGTVQVELANLQVVWQRALAQGDLDTIELAVVVFWRYYWLRNQGQEGHRILTLALEGLDRSSLLREHPRQGAVRAKLHGMRGYFHYFLGNFASGRESLQTALAIAQDSGHEVEAGEARLGLGVIARWQGEHGLAHEQLHNALTIFQRLEHRHGEADALHELAQLHSYGGNYEEAKRSATESLRIGRELGRSDWIAWALDALGWVSFCGGDYGGAQACYTESQSHFEAVGHQLGRSLALGGLGLVALARDRENWAEALALLEQSLAICRQIEHRAHEANRLAVLAQVYNDCEDYQGAQQYAQTGLAIARTLNSPYILVANLHGLAEAAYYQGDFGRSWRILHEACRAASAAVLLPQVLITLFHCATLLVIESEVGVTNSNQSRAQQSTAVELLQRVQDHPATWALYRARAASRLAELAAKWPADVHQQAEAHLAGRSLATTVTALLQNYGEPEWSGVGGRQR